MKTMQARGRGLRRRLFEIMEIGGTRTSAGLIFDVFMVLLILLNIMAVALETVQPLEQNYHIEFLWFEFFSLMIFGIEYLLRVWVCVEYRQNPDASGQAAFRGRFLFTPLMIIDFIAIAPTVMFSFLGIDFRILRVFRFLRLFKLMRYSPALGTLANVIYEERRALLAALIIMLGLILFSATLIYYLERHAQPEHFGNIPKAMWWAIATLTTVGYGDVVPVTVAGKFFGSFVMLFGLGMFALPIAIIASGFSSEIHRREFVVRWGLVASVPLFRGLDASLITTIAKYLRSRVVAEGKLIAHMGDKAERMYLIVSGEVARRDRKGVVTLKEGAFFGARSLYENTVLPASYIAKSRCQLLVLEANDFHHLMENHPTLNRRIREQAWIMEDYGQPEEDPSQEI